MTDTKKKKRTERSKELDLQFENALDSTYEMAEEYFFTKKEQLPEFVTSSLNKEFIKALESMAKACEKASGPYLNLLTSITVKCVLADKVDIRYHQVQIQDQTDKPAGFNFRGLSESVIYNWMEKHEFHGAKSGWQVRTLERPKPYFLNYDENIQLVKEPFLTCYDQIETHSQNPKIALAFLLWRRIQLRESAKVSLALPQIKDVLQITKLFESHFFYSYKDSKGGSRLPVLALYAIYKVLLKELHRYEGMKLKPLESHSAADSQTGAVGDIEIVYEKTGEVFEAVEVKHNIAISVAIIETAKQKICDKRIDRYYVLTTHPQHDPSEDVQNEVKKVQQHLGCQMIANGVIPTIKYYLRLLSDPSAVLPEYTALLSTEKGIGFEHRDIWNKIAMGKIAEETEEINKDEINRREGDLNKIISNSQNIIFPQCHNGCIPLYSIRVACGDFEDGVLPEVEGWVDANRSGFMPDKKKHFAVYAKGYSMQPMIHDGDICVFEWYKGGTRNGEIVLIQCRDNDPDYSGKYTIKKFHSEKRATAEGWEHKKIELIPLNKDYKTIELDADGDYRTIGVLKCVLKK